MPKKQKNYFWHLGFSYSVQKEAIRNGVPLIYFKDKKRIVLPFHAGKSLHPKIVKEVLEAVELLEN